MYKEEVLPGLVRISIAFSDIGNVYVLDDVLVDSGLSILEEGLIAEMQDFNITAHALTHAHADHQGASHAVCERLEIPLWCGEGDRAAMESGDLSRLLPNPGSLISKLAARMSGPPHPVSLSLREGDRVGTFTAIETPGHTPGHLSFWREADRALVLGDVLFNLHPLTLKRGLRPPFRMATVDPAMNRESARKVAELEPEVICFGHGAPLYDTQIFLEYISNLA
jgi:glyoxylase-like metal-dependent hydrolase (beta-lactamase superfamily II)